MADQYGIGGWPMFKMFRKGRVYEYNGPREKQNIIDFMKDQAKPPSEEKNHMLGIYKRNEIYFLTHDMTNIATLFFTLSRILYE